MQHGARARCGAWAIGALAIAGVGCGCGSGSHGPDATAGSDARPAYDAAQCRPERVRFVPPGGELRESQLCDDVFVCIDGDDDAARVRAASPAFECDGPDRSAVCPGRSCRYTARDGGGPALLDAEEIAEVCAVTRLAPPPRDIVCVVYVQ